MPLLSCEKVGSRRICRLKGMHFLAARTALPRPIVKSSMPSMHRCALIAAPLAFCPSTGSGSEQRQFAPNGCHPNRCADPCPCKSQLSAPSVSALALRVISRRCSNSSPSERSGHQRAVYRTDLGVRATRAHGAITATTIAPSQPISPPETPRDEMPIQSIRVASPGTAACGSRHCRARARPSAYAIAQPSPEAPDDPPAPRPSSPAARRCAICRGCRG